MVKIILEKYNNIINRCVYISYDDIDIIKISFCKFSVWNTGGISNLHVDWTVQKTNDR